MSFDTPLAPIGGPQPAPKRSGGLRVVLIIGAVLVVCVLVCCVGSVLFSSQIGSWSAGYLCQAEYSDLSPQQCTDWANTVVQQHPQDFVDCQQQSEAAIASGGQLDTLFKCLDDKGIGPKSK